jgi:hypothetical protein
LKIDDFSSKKAKKPYFGCTKFTKTVFNVLVAGNDQKCPPDAF